jgi:hypothetical protein
MDSLLFRFFQSLSGTLYLLRLTGYHPTPIIVIGTNGKSIDTKMPGNEGFCEVDEIGNWYETSEIAQLGRRRRPG